MPPGTFEALAVLLLAVVPGYTAIAAFLYGRAWQRPPTDLQVLLQSLPVSVGLQVLIAPLTLLLLGTDPNKWSQHTPQLAVWAAALLVVATFGAYVAGLVTDWAFDPESNVPLRVARLVVRDGHRSQLWARRLQSLWPTAQPPTIWDWLFSRAPAETFFVVVEMKDGRFVGGTFEEGSFALVSPQRQGLFLRTEWSVDSEGQLVAEVPGTGVMITDVDDIKMVRIVEST